MNAASPTRITSIAAAIETVEARLDAHPEASATPPMRAALNRLLSVPRLPIELPEWPSHPDYHRLLAADMASFDRNHHVMQNFLLTFFNDCEALGAMSVSDWIATLYTSMRDYLTVWFRAYALEIAPDGPGSPVETADWSLERLIAAYQTAQVADPADPTYPPPSLASLVAEATRYA